MAKAAAKRRLLVGDPEQVLIRNNDQRVDMLGKLFDATIGGQHTALAFEVERLGDNTNRQDALLLCRPRNYRRCAGAGATAHASGDEHHVCAGQVIQYLRQRLFGCTSPDLRLRPCSEPLRQIGPHLDAAFCRTLQNCLCVSIRNNEFNPFKIGLDHVVDGIAPCTTDAENSNTRF